MRRKGTGEQWQRLRHIAANMMDQGQTPAMIAAALEVDAQTVRFWRRNYRKAGRAALASRKPSGRPAKFTQQQRDRLAELLLKTPAECGFDKYLWTQQLIADLVLREFDISFHHDYIGVLLGEMGFTHQKPQRQARERDPQRVAQWRAEIWPALLKKVPTPKA